MTETSKVNNEVNLAWEKPTTNANGEALAPGSVSSYEIEVARVSGTITFVANMNATSYLYRVPAATEGEQVDFRIRTVANYACLDSDGNVQDPCKSEWSALASVVLTGTPNVAPEAPQAFTAASE